jgi:hypothetical protein
MVRNLVAELSVDLPADAVCEEREPASERGEDQARPCSSDTSNTLWLRARMHDLSDIRELRDFLSELGVPSQLQIDRERTERAVAQQAKSEPAEREAPQSGPALGFGGGASEGPGGAVGSLLILALSWAASGLVSNGSYDLVKGLVRVWWEQSGGAIAPAQDERLAASHFARERLDSIFQTQLQSQPIQEVQVDYHLWNFIWEDDAFTYSAKVDMRAMVRNPNRVVVGRTTR